MQARLIRHSWAVCLALVLAATVVPAAEPLADDAIPETCQATRDEVVRVGELALESFDTPHPYPPGSVAGHEVWSHKIDYPGASYIAVHFERFDLAPGDVVVLTDATGEVNHLYGGKGHLEKGGDFWGLSVPGDTMIITLMSRNPNHTSYGYRIDHYAHGFPVDTAPPDQTRAVCGTEDFRDAKCYETSHPEEYDRSRPVVKLLMNGLDHCTGWLGSCENHLITNQHCVSTQAQLDNIEFQFMYQRPDCGSGTPSAELQLQGGTLLEADWALDYALIVPNLAGNDPQAVYGYMKWDLRVPDIDERIYIPGHPSGDPKRLSIFSTHSQDQSGNCEVYSTNQDPCHGGGGDIGYYCDTEGGSSGSPVLSGDSNKVVALHHCAYCPNRGTKIVEVYNDIQASAHPLPDCVISDPDPPGDEYYPTDTATSTLVSGFGPCMGDSYICHLLRFEDLQPLPPSTDIVMHGGGWSGDCFMMGWRCPKEQVDVYVNDPNLDWPVWCLIDGEGYTLYDGNRYDFRGVSVNQCTPLPFYFDYEYLCSVDTDCYPGHLCNTQTGICYNPCPDADSDGWTTCDGDCNDNNPDVNPGHPEVCGNSLDDDCDGAVNEGCGTGSPIFRKPNVQVVEPQYP